MTYSSPHFCEVTFVWSVHSDFLSTRRGGSPGVVGGGRGQLIANAFHFWKKSWKNQTETFEGVILLISEIFEWDNNDAKLMEV